MKQELEQKRKRDITFNFSNIKNRNEEIKMKKKTGLGYYNVFSGSKWVGEVIAKSPKDALKKVKLTAKFKPSKTKRHLTYASEWNIKDFFRGGKK